MNTKVMFKRILVILLSTFLLLGTINIISFADITKDQKGTIIVEDVEPNVKVSVYKLTNVLYDYNEDNLTSNQPFEPPYEWDEKIKNWLTTNNYQEYTDPETFQETIEGNAEEIAKFYDHLASAIKSKAIDLDATATGQAVNGVPGEADQKVAIEGLEMGTYLVLIENGYKVYSPSVVNLVPTYNEEEHTWKMSSPAIVEIKSSELTITKTVDKEDASTTDTLKYTITADVPNYPEKSLAKKYYISDILSKGLRLENNSTIQVYGVSDGASDVLLTSGNGYNVTSESAHRPCGEEDATTTFTIEFDYDKIKQYKKVKVVYEARLNQNDDVVLAGDGNQNNAYLDYSNNPYDETSWNTQTTSKKVYTYQIELSKIDKIQKELFLTGAHFTLSADANGNDTIKFIKLSDGTYYKSDDATKGDSELTSDLEVNSSGKLYIRGLDVGKYYLTETKAPEGYNKLSTIKEITITHGLNTTLNVENKEGFVLPLTGGIGTTIFVVIGSVLFGIGLLLVLVMVIKKSKLDKNTK